MSEEYPLLKSIGIQNPQEVISYSSHNSRIDMDVLRVRYKRPKGSFLPVTRTYQFGRKGKFETVDSGSRKSELVYEVSPLLEQVRAELDKIVNKRDSQDHSRQHLLNEMDRVQELINAEMSGLRKLIDTVKDD